LLQNNINKNNKKNHREQTSLCRPPVQKLE